MERLFLCEAPPCDGQIDEEPMVLFRKSTPAKSVMFLVNYDDARTAYLWIDNPAKAGDPRTVGLIARAQQKQGTLPEGNIATIRRVR
jgi:hypothetical protein